MIHKTYTHFKLHTQGRSTRKITQKTQIKNIEKKLTMNKMEKIQSTNFKRNQTKEINTQ